MPERPDEDLVVPEHACPLCGERSVDHLAWIDEQWVRCHRCGIQYDPDAEAGDEQ